MIPLAPRALGRQSLQRVPAAAAARFIALQQRSYATVNGLVPKELAKKLANRPDRNRYGARIPVERVVRFHQYEELVQRAEWMCVLQAVNPPTHELQMLQYQARQSGLVLKWISNYSFRKACLHNGLANFAELLFGPCVVIYPKKLCYPPLKTSPLAASLSAEALAPPLASAAGLRDACRIADASERLLLLGASFDGRLLPADLVRRVAELPDRAALQGELVALLQSAPQSLIRALSRPGQSLHSVLVSRQQQLGESV